MEPGTDDGPAPSDNEGWRRAIADQRLGVIRAEAMVATIQTIGPDGDQRVLGPLMEHLADRITRILKKCVGRNKANREDIIDRAQFELLEAVLQPQSSDGKGLRAAFYARVQFRAADAIRKEDKQARRELSDDNEETAGGDTAEHTAWPEPEKSAHVAGVLRKIADWRKRFAFRLHMDGVPFESDKGISIARALGVSSKTAAGWVDEARNELKLILEEAND